MHEHVHIPLIAEQDPSAANLALNVTSGVSCEHPGHPGEENRRTEGRIVRVRWTEEGRGKELTRTLSNLSKQLH